MKMCEVDPETVGQYTGLKDLNGEKIFEGDIIFNRHNVVEWCNGGFCLNGDRPLSEGWCSKVEVLGNIFDNPELMGGEQSGNSGQMED